MSANKGKAVAKLSAFLELGKLKLSSLAVFAVLAGLFMGSPGTPSLKLTIGTLLGTLLVAIGGSALNMYREREKDVAMDRTSQRPLPTGRLHPASALAFGSLSALTGVTLLYFLANPYAAALCGLIFVTYVFVYTPLKYVTTLNTLVGAVPGGLPPMVGYVAGSGVIDDMAVVLFLILFFWQIPHFLAIAWRYRDDYARAGMKMLPVVYPDGHSTAVQMVLYGACLLVVSLAPWFLRQTNDLYMFAAVGLGVIFMVPILLAAKLRNPTAMRLCFLVSIIYLPLLFLVMVLDKSYP